VQPQLEFERLSVYVQAAPVLITAHVPDDTFKSQLDDNKPAFPQEILSGTWIEIHGLLGTPHLNGCKGLVLELQAATGRYIIELSDGHKKLINGKNLRPITSQPKTSESSVSKVPSAAVINSGRYKVELRDGSAKLVKAHNLEIQEEETVGETVTVDKDQKRCGSGAWTRMDVG